MEENNYPSLLIGKVHGLLLKIGMVCFALMVITAVAYAAAPDFYLFYLETADTMLSFFSSVLYVIINITFCLWLIQVHYGLLRLNPYYPTSPSGAVIRVLPFINIWGFADLFIPMSRLFRKDPATTPLAKLLILWLRFLYVAYFGDLFLNITYSTNYTVGSLHDGTLPERMLYMAASFADLFLLIICLAMTSIVNHCMRILQ